jgi:hypothetical protein
MKTKIPVLIIGSLFLATVSKAQYRNPSADKRIVIQAQFVIPGHTLVGYSYNNTPPQEQFAGYNENIYGGSYAPVERYNRNAAVYDHYCRENRKYHISREEFYQDRCNYREVPRCAPKRVVRYSY